jgi:hypothetical protein
MKKKIAGYLLAAVIVFLVVLLAGVLWMHLKWSESGFLSAFLTIVGVGGYWWKEEGLG